MIPIYRKNSLEKHYKKLYELGKGGMGITYAAEDIKTGEKVALKVISLGNMTEAESFELLEREVTVLKQLNHPNIPKYIDFFQLEEDKNLYLVQQLIPGKDLNKQIEEGLRLTEIEVENIAKKVLFILDYLHNFNPCIIHRDIKPHNLIRCEDGKIFLVDFGAVQNTYYNTVIGGTIGIGTIGYMSPEQQRGKPVPASDLYSLGRTLLYLLTGCPPNHLLEHKETVNLQEIRSYIQVSDQFIQWLEKILEPDVDERFSSAKEASKMLKNSKLLKEVQSSKIRRFTWLGLGIAGVAIATFSYSYKWAILNSLGFPAPLPVCVETNITSEYVRSAGELAKIAPYKCGVFLNTLIRENKKETIELLINHGADVNVKDKDGNAPLPYATWQNKKETIELLINYGADVNVKDKDGNTPLLYATGYNEKEIAELLINHGADVNVKDKDGNTPLLYSTWQKNKEIAELLINHGADVNLQNKDGNTPLLYAVRKNKKETIELLINYGADINLQDKDGNTPLLYATWYNKKETIELLINHGADVNVKDKDGNTPLLYAARDNKKEIAKLLIKHGADVNVKDKEGNTPLLYAARENNKEIAKLLIKHGAKSYY